MKMTYTFLFSIMLILPVDWSNFIVLNKADTEIGIAPQEDIRSKMNSLLDVKNKLEEDEIVVLNLWGTWCKPCIEEIPQLNALVKDYSNKGVRFLAFSDEDPSRLEKFNLDNQKNKRLDYKFLYKQIFGNREATSYIKSMNTEFKGDPVPIHVLLKKDGSMGLVLLGASPSYDKMMRDFLESEITN